MKKLLILFTLLLSAHVSASNFDVIYRFDSSVNDDYFQIKVDFDYVGNDSVFFYDEEVFNYDQFLEVLVIGNIIPVFFFEIEVLDTNMPSQFSGTGIGFTEAAPADQLLQTVFMIGGFGIFATSEQTLDLLNFPTGWEAGQIIELITPSGEVPFVLTEVTQIPIPAALPLFGLSLLVLVRRGRG